MKTCHPLVKLINTGNGHYLYDGKTNRIVKISAAMYHLLTLPGNRLEEELITESQKEHKSEDIIEGLDLLERLDDDFGIFAESGLERRTLGPIDTDDARTILEKGSSQLILEVTEACNFRCRYCVFSGGYGTQRRTHGNRHMSWDVARAAMDFYYARSRALTNTSIGWYGGEPLIRFDLVRRCVDYARNLDWVYPEGLHFSVTTNGSLLTDEIIDFLVTNNVGVLISLDGPRSEHDRNRITVDGTGTFSRVFGRAQRLIQRMTREANRVARFLAVYAPDTDLLAVNDFFVEQRIAPERTSPISPGHGGFGSWIGSRADGDALRLYKRYCQTLGGLKNHDTSFIKSMFEDDFIRIYKREISTVIENAGGTGACFPGSHRIYVSVDGVFHMCERTPNTIPIGDVWQGWDLPWIVELVNTFRRFMDSQDCRNCWAVRFCPICYVHLATNDGQLIPPPSSICNAHKSNFEERLTTYCRILELNPHAFDHMKDIHLVGYSERS